MDQPIDAAQGSAQAENLRVARALYPRSFAWLARRVRDSSVVAEMVEDVLADACSQIQGPLDTESAWAIVVQLLKAARAQHARQHRRDRRRSPLALDVATPATEADPQYREILWQWEDAAMAKRSPAQRAALESHVMDEVSDAVIAERIGCSRKSVKVLRNRAKHRLQLLVARGDLPLPPR